MKTVSVILTTYNSEKTVQRAIDSVLKQDGIDVDFRIELIIVDDCSTDRTTRILEQNGIRYHSTRKNSGGPNRGRNMGLDVATGDYICIMDHDDEWMPEKIKSQLELSQLAPIISSGYTTVNELNGDRKNYVSKFKNSPGHIIYDENETFLTLLSRSKKGQITYIGGLMYHHSLKDIRFEEKFAQIDFDWGLRLFKDRRSLEICKPLYIRYIIGGNLSLNEEYRLNDYHYSSLTVEHYKHEYPLQIREFYRRINGTLGRYYYHKEEMDRSRKYFLKAGFSIKTIFYLLTSYYGYKLVNKWFRVF